MHKLVNALMSWFLWQPPARLMRQVTFPIKMVIIATAVAVSLVWLLWVMVGGKLQGIDATTQELAGVRYASAIYPAMDLAGVWRQQSRNAAFGEGGDQLPQARQAFDLAFKKLQAMDAEVGQSLQVSRSFAALRSAVQAAQAVQPSAGVKADPEVVYQGMIGVSRTLADLLDAVTDGSGLVLDPDLASYHLMSAVLLRAPDVIQTTVEIRGLVRTALKAGQITPDNVARLEGFLVSLARDTAQAKFSLDKVQKAAPFYGQKLTRGAVIATEEFLESVRVNVPVEASTVQGDAAAFVKLANQTLQSQFKQVEGNLNVLEAMLVDRQSALRQDLWLALAITALSQLVAAYFGMGFFVAMQNGFTTLRHHLITISMGDLRGIIEVSGHDEMSAMLKELGNMQLALSQTVQQVQQA
ncbi:MAG: methyl-accepting chemotaxis protein, partial [Rhodoferax sp.]|nr:methyl-accepting chemotaxis protein [Rhodoferax sp.]